MLGGMVPYFNVPNLEDIPPARAIVFWAASKLFGATLPLVYTGSGSGDKTYDWVSAFCTLVISLAGATIWTALDRRRPDHATLYRWFYLFLRFALGSTMLVYGMIKFVPLQMPFPSLTRLVEPYGNFSPMGVLWYSIGASPAYEMFVGAAELFGGVLLFFPRTAFFGAMVCLADTVDVFTLNMTYDVPVKLFSFHLILMSIFLLAPELRRMAVFFFMDRPVAPSRRQKLFQSTRWNRVALIVQVVWGLALVANAAYGDAQSWYQYGGGAAKSALYGIWNIQGDPQWRRVIFDRPTGMAWQKTDDTMVTYTVSVDAKAGTVDVTKGKDKGWGKLKFERAGTNTLTLDGAMGPDKVHLQTHLQDRGKMPLVSRGFHWVQEYPFNR
jgi:hypothetical protein